MPTPRRRTPSYRRHKPSGQAVVTLAGRDHYLGKYGSPESRAEYDRVVGEWLVGGRRAPGKADSPGTDLTINELILAYLGFADGYYVKDGRPTTEPRDIRLAIRPLRRLYAHSPAGEFGPLALKAVRGQLIESGLCRTEVNKRIGRIVRAFKWAVGEEILPASVYHALRAVPGLRRGRTTARESAPVRPVPDALVDAVRPHVARQVWAMIELQRLTGMRPGEVTALRTADVDRTGPVWIYTPAGHKTEHHGKRRCIALGPRARDALGPWLRSEEAAYLFSPREAMAERQAAKRQRRRTPVQPSQRDRRKRAARRVPGGRYDVAAYNRAIEYGCRKAGVPKWHPHQLRHNVATRLRKEFGLDTARAVLGHSSTAVTEIYAELDGAKAAEAMERIG